MNRLLALALCAGLMLCACTPVLAVDIPIPSSATGTYEGSGATQGWRCQVQLFQIGSAVSGTNRVQDVDCAVPGDRVSGATSTLDACITDRAASPLVPWSQTAGPWVTPSTPRFAIVTYLPVSAICPLGQLDVAIGANTSAFCRTQVFVPLTPYPDCATVVKPISKPKR